MCEYGDSKDRIIRDILFKGCASSKARDTIIRKGDKILLSEVLDILQAEDATDNTHQTIKEIDSSTRMEPNASVHYASYENNKKSKKKPHSTEQNTNSTNSTKSCYRCGEPYSKEHEPVCRAQEAFCNGCGKKGHFHIVCRSSGKFPQKQKPNSTDRKQTHYISDDPSASSSLVSTMSKEIG